MLVIIAVLANVPSMNTLDAMVFYFLGTIVGLFGRLFDERNVDTVFEASPRISRVKLKAPAHQIKKVEAGAKERLDKGFLLLLSGALFKPLQNCFTQALSCPLAVYRHPGSGRHRWGSRPP